MNPKPFENGEVGKMDFRVPRYQKPAAIWGLLGLGGQNQRFQAGCLS
jgi:hypothetical protein